MQLLDEQANPLMAEPREQQQSLLEGPGNWTMAELREQVSRKCSLWEHARHPAAVDNAACWLEACVSSEVQSSFAAMPLPS